VKREDETGGAELMPLLAGNQHRTGITTNGRLKGAWVSTLAVKPFHLFPLRPHRR